MRANNDRRILAATPTADPGASVLQSSPLQHLTHLPQCGP